MYADSERELEQLKRLDKFRKLAQTILSRHLMLLIISFVLIFSGILVFVGIAITSSPNRYLAQLTLCFQPKQKGKVGHYDDRYVLQIINRRASRLKFVEMGEKESGSSLRKVVSENIVISFDRRHPHTFSISLRAQSESEAVDSINEFAKVCIAEYVSERTRDLQNWKHVLEEERKDIYKEVQTCDAAMSKLTVPLNVVTPEKDYERLRTRINELQASRTRLSYVMENLTRRKTELEKALAKMNPSLLTSQTELKRFFAELERLDKEIAQAEELYTEENPKMIALISRRNGEQKRLDRFLKEKNVGSVDPQMLREAETLSTELKSLLLELDGKKGELLVLDGEISDCTKRFRLLTEYQPKLRQLTQQRRNLRESLARLDESISEINYTLLMVGEDLFVNEKARSAIGTEPFSKKNLFICLFAAIALTGFIAAVVALAEFFFGRVTNAKELMLYEEFPYLGVLPTSEKVPNAEDMERIVMFNLFHKFQSTGMHVLFTGALPGAKIFSPFFDFLDWNLSMAGRRMLTVDMVQAEEFDIVPDENSDTMLLAFSKGKCYLPLTSRKFLITSELELLKNDFDSLKDRYDYIFIRHTTALRRSELFFEQIAALCDGALVAVGARKTPRKSLRRLLSVQLRIKIPVMTVLSDTRAGAVKSKSSEEAEL
ncbi:MAG: hypothetical protein IJS01_02185 [Lentisphaeria bacterium]|nr:hypothetical protein [Lentisphaeria bacterium]